MEQSVLCGPWLKETIKRATTTPTAHFEQRLLRLLLAVDGNHRRLCPCTGLYDPCAGKKEGAACTFCDPAKKDCKETGGAGKTCQGGECKAPLHWVLDAKAEGDHSCDNVCADEGGTCDQAEIDKLKTDDDVKKAFKEALGGYECKSVNKGCEGGNNCVKWGSPFVHNSHYNAAQCFFGFQPSHAPCGQKPVDGNHRRLCPCRGVKLPKVRWVLDAKAEGDHSCENVCKDEGGKCNQAAIDGLKTDDDVKAAFKAALGGYSCKSVSKGCEGGNNCVKWGSPYVHNSHYNAAMCFFGFKPSHAPCGQKPGSCRC